MKTPRFLFVLVGLFLLGGPACAAQDAPLPTVMDEVRVPMADDVTLRTLVFRPEQAGTYPVVLYIPPYDIDNPHRQALGTFLAAHGYVMVMQAPRGKYGSDGTYLPFIDEVPDLMATLEWALVQPWSNGDVGIYGSSSSSYSGQLLAATQHPAIKALVNKSGLTDTQDLFFPGGTFRLNTLYPWLTFFYLGERFPFDQWPARFEAWPVSSGFGWEPGLLDRMAQQGMVDVAKIEVPTLHITGWNDVVYRHTLRLFEGIAENRGGTVPQKLIMGPWMHNYDGEQTQFGDVDYGPDSQLSTEAERAEVLAWFDQHLKGEPKNNTQAPVRVFVMGENQWVESEQWPLAGTTEKRWYLAPSGTLSEDAPTGTEQMSFTYDPAHPVPSYGGVNSHLFPEDAGPRDQAPFAERSDVLVFTSAPIEDTYTLAGRIRMVLYAATDAPDTDFTAKLVVIRPDGYQMIVEDGIVRARYHNGYPVATPITPGEVFRYEIDLGWTALRLEAGERLGVHISSSNFPKYARNPNTGDDPLHATSFQPATQTIHLSPAQPSHLVLTVVD